MELYKHQKDVIDKLSSGSILCGGVGTGKSLTSLGYYKKFYKEKPLYIITTAKKRDSLEWEQECSKSKIFKKVIIDSWNNIKKYKKVHGAFFIFDEQRVVGSGVWVKSFLKISKQNKWILLTATPGDTWSDYIPVFVANNFYKNKTEFLREHAVYNRFTKYPKIDKYIGTNKLLGFKRKIVIDMYYEKQTRPIVRNIKAEYDKTLFDITYKKRWNPFTNKPIKNISSFCYILRKIVNSNESRIDIVSEVYKNHKRVIIFYNFNYELDLLLRFCKLKKITHAQWNGHVHEEVPLGDKWIYLVQYTAGAEGWNCVSTDTILFYSQNYSYRTVTQAAGRIDRLNTLYKDLYYYHITSDSKIDEAISKALKEKKNFNAATFN